MDEMSEEEVLELIKETAGTFMDKLTHDERLRVEALELAITSQEIGAKKIVETAEKFEAYITGEEDEDD